MRQKERELQERITTSQNSFRDRNRVLQETAQYELGQIERTLIGVIRQVSESRGMNLVLHRAQVALNINEFDITEQVTQQMNKVMPLHHHPAGRRLAFGAEPGAGAGRHGGPAADPGLGTTDPAANAPLTWSLRRTRGSSAAPARTRSRRWWRRPTPRRGRARSCTASPRCNRRGRPRSASWTNKLYAPQLEATQAGAVIVHPSMASRVPPGSVAIVTPEPYLAWARVAALFHPLPLPAAPGVHPSAVVDASARIDPSAEIGPLAYVGAHAEIGPFCRIGPGAVIGDAVQLGPHCRVGAQATLTHAVLGARVYVYPGARIGQEGFGFAVGRRRLRERAATRPRAAGG